MHKVSSVDFRLQSRVEKSIHTKTSLRIVAARQTGVTGLETAIIVISFVVVASVFAFTVLSTGIFSAERGRETVFAGHEQARGSVELKGSVIAPTVSSPE